MQEYQVIRYAGGKWGLANQLINLFPEHHSYLELFFGSGAILFNKKPSAIETVNDLNSDVVNLFECVRNDPERLAREISLTPYARDEYAGCLTPAEDNFEKARKFLIRQMMSIGMNQRTASGWRRETAARESHYCVRDWNKMPERIMNCCSRLKDVQIENTDALELIQKFSNEKVFIYADPPYLMETREYGKRYEYEMSKNDHIKFLELARGNKAKIMISGYRSKLYDEALEGWDVAEFNARANQGGKRTEVIWCNFEITQQLSMAEFAKG